MARARQRLAEPAADEAGGAGDQHALSARQRPDQVGRAAEDEPLRPARSEKVTQAEHDHAGCRQRGQHAADTIPNRNDRGRLLCPADQNRNEQREDGTVVDGQQRVGDALACRQLSAQVLLDKVGERDDDFRRQHGNHQHRPEALEIE